jgi:hypothetical protein
MSNLSLSIGTIDRDGTDVKDERIIELNKPGYSTQNKVKPLLHLRMDPSS